MNARLKLIGTSVLLCLALGLTVFCAVQTVQAIQSFEKNHNLALSGDVSTIRPWMTLHYISQFYHVPESYLYESLHITDPQSVSPGTAMPSGLFKQQDNRYVFAGPTPPTFNGYEGDHRKLLTDYIFQLTPEEQKRVASSMPRAKAAMQPSTNRKQAALESHHTASGGSR